MSEPFPRSSHEIETGAPLPAALGERGERPRPGLRFMLYSHDGLGLGHFRRNLVLARSLIERVPRTSVLLACSAEGIETFSLPAGVDVLRLPGLRKLANGRYVGRRLRMDESDLLTLRAGLLASAVADFRPHVLVADKHPLGLGGELVPALQQLRRQGGRAALGLRDVLDDAAAASDEWRRSDLGRRTAELYDLALVYGSANVLNPVAEGMLPQPLAEKVRFCGYVVGTTGGEGPSADLPFDGAGPIVLATVGGGEDGHPVLDAFIEAARGAQWRGIAVAGPQMDRALWTRLHDAAANAGVAAFRSVQQVQGWYGRADALVCMGGYNTLLEALAAPIPTVCIPRVHPRREQLIRARAFAERDLLQVLEPAALTATSLAQAIGVALGTTRATVGERVRRALDLGGAQRAASFLIELAEGAATQRRLATRVMA